MSYSYSQQEIQERAIPLLYFLKTGPNSYQSIEHPSSGHTNVGNSSSQLPAFSGAFLNQFTGLGLTEAKTHDVITTSTYVIFEHGVAFTKIWSATVPAAYKDSHNYKSSAQNLKYNVNYEIITSNELSPRGVAENRGNFSVQSDDGFNRSGLSLQGSLLRRTFIILERNWNILNIGKLRHLGFILYFYSSYQQIQLRNGFQEPTCRTQSLIGQSSSSESTYWTEWHLSNNKQQPQNQEGDGGHPHLDEKVDGDQADLKEQQATQLNGHSQADQEIKQAKQEPDLGIKEQKKEAPSKPSKASYEIDKATAAKLGKNVEFFLGYKSPRRDLTIESFLLKWKGEFEELERDHAYIQLIFPNFYESRFNMSADPLIPKEAQAFRRNQTIATRFMLCYDLFMEFLGLEVCNKKTGALKLIDSQKCPKEKAMQKRLRYRLLVCTHNQLRMWRIFSSLSATGFWKYAQRLIDYLAVTIIGKAKYFSNLKHFIIDISEERVKEIDEAIKKGYLVEGAFKRFTRSFFYFEKWIVFASEDSKRVAIAACTPKDDSHIKEESIYFKLLKEQKK